MSTNFHQLLFLTILLAICFIVGIGLAITGPKKAQSQLTVLASALGVLALICCALAFYNAGQANKTPENLSAYECRQVTTLHLVEPNSPYGAAAASLEKQHDANHCKGGYRTKVSGQPAVSHKFKK